MEFAVVELNGAAVLHAAMKGLHFAVALDGLGNMGRGNGERDDEERQKEDGREQNVALPREMRGTGSRPSIATVWAEFSCAAQNADSVSVCVLL